MTWLRKFVVGLILQRPAIIWRVVTTGILIVICLFLLELEKEPVATIVSTFFSFAVSFKEQVAITILIFFSHAVSVKEQIAIIVSTFLSLAVSFYIASIIRRDYKERTESEFAVNYEVENDTGKGDISASDMPYVKNIYIRNKKNRLEAIQKIVLKISENDAVLLLDSTRNPLIIKAYDCKNIKLAPVSYYSFYKKEVCNLKGLGECEISKEKYAVIEKDTDAYYIFGDNFQGKHEIILQTTEGTFFIKPNLKADNEELGKMKTFFPNSSGDRYGTVLSYGVKVVCFIEFSKKPQDIQDQDIFRTRDIREFSVKVEDEEARIRGNFKKEIINLQAKTFGVQVVMYRETGKHHAQYYFLDEENKKHVLHFLVPWWDDFYTKYLESLREYSPGARPGSCTIKSSIKPFGFFYDELRKFLEEEKNMELANKRANDYFNSDLAYSAEGDENYQERGTYNPDEEKAYTIQKIIKKIPFVNLPNEKRKWLKFLFRFFSLNKKTTPFN